MSKEELTAIKSLIANYLQKRWIYPNASLYGALVKVVHQKDGPLHICINYWLLANKYGLVLTKSHILMSCWIDSQKRGFTPSWTLLQDST